MFAAAVPPGRVFMSPLPEYLRIIRENESRWRASAWGFAVSTVLMAIGLAIATSPAASRLYGVAAFAVFVVVAPCWLGTLALRLDLTVAAALGRVDHAWYDAIGKWSGSLYAIFMVGSYAAVALLGASQIGGGVPQLAAWTTAAVGAVAALSFWVGWPRAFGMRSPFELPVLVPLLSLVVAIPFAVAV
ncbi:MAG TPA: hypothetical protein VGS17_12615 [Candidatus Limnocylindria bacterium]|nr:hypothetical protein [Candidatus Limnocylindria bacterium]